MMQKVGRWRGRACMFGQPTAPTGDWRADGLPGVGMVVWAPTREQSSGMRARTRGFSLQIPDESAYDDVRQLIGNDASKK